MWSYLILGIVGLVGYGLAWYYRNRASVAEQTVAVVTDRARGVVTAYSDLKGQYSAAVDKLRELQDEDAARDYETAAKIITADDAAEFLRESTKPAGNTPKARLQGTRRARRSNPVLGFARRSRNSNPA